MCIRDSRLADAAKADDPHSLSIEEDIPVKKYPDIADPVPAQVPVKHGDAFGNPQKQGHGEFRRRLAAGLGCVDGENPPAGAGRHVDMVIALSLIHI